MNERIRELAVEAKIEFTYDPTEKPIRAFVECWEDELEKFAELLIRECVGLCDKAAEENARTFYTVTETQEVGPALVSKGSQVQAEKLSRQIKQHFGVEE